MFPTEFGQPHAHVNLRTAAQQRFPTPKRIVVGVLFTLILLLAAIPLSAQESNPGAHARPQGRSWQQQASPRANQGWDGQHRQNNWQQRCCQSNDNQRQQNWQRRPQNQPPANPPAKSQVTAAPALNPSYYDESPLPISGKAMYYNPGIMDRVLDYRLDLKQVEACGECVGYVALLRKGDLNRRVWIEWADGEVEGPFLVIDVAGRSHIGSLLARNWVVDVDNVTAKRHKMAGPVSVSILDRAPIARSFLLAAGTPLPQ